MLKNKQNPGMVPSKTITGILFVKKLFYQCCQRFLIVQADCGFYQLAAFENQQAGDAHDSKFFCQLRIIVNVAFGNLDIERLPESELAYGRDRTRMPKNQRELFG